MSGAERGAVVKLGGSVITEKGSVELRVRDDVVGRLGAELAASAVTPLALVHGAGSFGHAIVHRTGLHLGLRSRQGLLDFGETQRLQYELDARVARTLLESGLPVMPIQASATAVMRDGVLDRIDLEAAALMTERGLVPLLYGVPAVDLVRGCSILSGDEIAPRLAARLGVKRLVHATDVDGVYEADPARNPGARKIDRIDQDNWGEVEKLLGGSRAVDVTGGMLGKVRALIEWARKGLATRIVDATRPGALAAALAGEPVGTLVVWNEEAT